MTEYNRTTLDSAYRACGVRAGQVIYLTGNLGRLGFPVDQSGAKVRDKEAIAELHVSVLETILGPSGTIAFPAHSWGEVGAETVFDPLLTPSDYTLGQYILKTRNCWRQIHPFASMAATGAQSANIISANLSKHVYGVGSPMERLSEMDALHVSVGLPIAKSISAVHHCEALALVPYRYVKSFRKKIRQNGQVKEEEVYLHVLYRETDLVLTRDRNETIVSLSGISGGITECEIGRSRMSSLPLRRFIKETLEAMQANPYIWLRQIDGSHPWAR